MASSAVCSGQIERGAAPHRVDEQFAHPLHQLRVRRDATRVFHQNRLGFEHLDVAVLVEGVDDAVLCVVDEQCGLAERVRARDGLEHADLAAAQPRHHLVVSGHRHRPQIWRLRRPECLARGRSRRLGLVLLVALVLARALAGRLAAAPTLLAPTTAVRFAARLGDQAVEPTYLVLGRCERAGV
eukprot:2619515-Prymnesium_polylepis.1